MEAKGSEERRIVKILAMRGTHRRNVEYQVRWDGTYLCGSLPGGRLGVFR